MTLGLALGVLLVVASGFFLCTLMAPRLKFWERVGVGYALGFGVLTLVMFLMERLRIHFSFEGTTAALALLGAAAAAFAFRERILRPRSLRFGWRSPLSLRGASVPYGTLVGLVAAAVVLVLLSALVVAWYFPVHWWDAVALYDFRAKVFADTRSIMDSVPLLGSYTMASRPLTSLVHTWVYLAGGDQPRFFYPLLFASLVVAFYHSVRSSTSALGALVFSLVLVSMPVLYGHATGDYTNLPFAVYFGMGTIYLYRGMVGGSKGLLFLGGLLLGLATWTRSEAFPFFVGYAALLFLFSLVRRDYFAWLFFVIPYMVVEPQWDLLVGAISPGGGAAGSASVLVTRLASEFIDWQHLAKVLSFLWDSGQVDLPGTYGVAIYLFAAFVALEFISGRFRILLFALVVSDLAVFLVGTYLFTKSIYVFSVPGSANRAFMLVVAPMLFYAASSPLVDGALFGLLFRRPRAGAGKEPGAPLAQEPLG